MNIINTDPDWGMADVRSEEKKRECREDAVIIRRAVKVINKYGSGQQQTLQMIEDLAQRLER
jgi:hypothetical protein